MAGISLCVHVAGWALQCPVGPGAKGADSALFDKLTGNCQARGYIEVVNKLLELLRSFLGDRWRLPDYGELVFEAHPRTIPESDSGTTSATALDARYQ